MSGGFGRSGARRFGGGLGGCVALRRGGGLAAAAAGVDARAGLALEAAQGAAQALEFATQVLVLFELLFDVGDARLDAVGDRRNVEDVRHADSC